MMHDLTFQAIKGKFKLFKPSVRSNFSSPAYVQCSSVLESFVYGDEIPKSAVSISTSVC